MKSSITNRSGLQAFLGLLLALGLSACATKDAHWVHENLELTENFHAGTKVLETPIIPDTGVHQARLRATGRSRGRRVGADIELAVRAVTVVKRVPEDCGTTDKSLCNVHEFVTVKLSRNYLSAKRASGFNVKLWGRRDSVVLFVPPQYIEGLLARMEDREPQTAEEMSTTTQGPVPASPAPGSTNRR